MDEDTRVTAVATDATRSSQDIRDPQQQQEYEANLIDDREVDDIGQDAVAPVENTAVDTTAVHLRKDSPDGHEVFSVSKSLGKQSALLR